MDFLNGQNGVGNGVIGGVRQNWQPPPKLVDQYGFPLRMPDDDSQDVIPAPLTFGSILNTIAKTYSFRWDEALRASTINALAMPRDTYIQSLLQERYMPTVNRAWQIVGEDPTDPEQQQAADIATKSTKQIDNFETQLLYLMEACWYGRYGSQVTWEERSVGGGVKAWGLASHTPVNGDKIQGAWDKTPVIFINQGIRSRYPDEYIVMTDRVPGLKLAKQSWREQFIIHRHKVNDADYFEGEMAGQLQGVGLRSMIYWCWWMRDECLSWALDFMKKAGALGLLIFWYDQSNPKARTAAEQNALKSSKQTALVAPRSQGKDASGRDDVSHIQIGTGGVEVLQNMISNYFERHMERLIVGQTLSAGTEGSGLGGSGVADMHTDTKFQLLKFDARNLAGTLTRDYLSVWMRKNYPSAKFRLRFEFMLPDPEAKDKMQAAKDARALGIPIKAEDVRVISGFKKPGPDDELATGGGPPDAGGPGGAPPGAPGADPNAPPGGDAMQMTSGQEQPTQQADTGDEFDFDDAAQYRFEELPTLYDYDAPNRKVERAAAWAAERYAELLAEHGVESARFILAGIAESAGDVALKEAVRYFLDEQPALYGSSPIKALQKIGKELAECGLAMPGYGQIFLKKNGSGEVWLVGGDGDEDGYGKLAKKKLLAVEGIDEVTYEAEAFPPRDGTWMQVYPKEREWIKKKIDLEDYDDYRLDEEISLYGKKYSCVLIPLPPKAADKLKQMAAQIPDADLGDDGREDKPHVTVYYGLHTEEPKPVAEVVSGYGPVKMTLGKVTCFLGKETGRDYDVVKVAVESRDLKRLHRMLAKLPHTDNHPEYIPHATIAYVKAGLGQKWADELASVDESVEADSVIFSNTSKEKTTINLAKE